MNKIGNQIEMFRGAEQMEQRSLDDTHDIRSGVRRMTQEMPAPARAMSTDWGPRALAVAWLLVSAWVFGRVTAR